jgi:hypothetical protein
MDLQSEIDHLEVTLALPSNDQLRPYLEKLIMNPGSAIVIGIELRAGELRVGRAWLTPAERTALRKGLERVNERRSKRNEKRTDEEERTYENESTATKRSGGDRAP